jgi:hypothetical protein
MAIKYSIIHNDKPFMNFNEAVYHHDGELVYQWQGF